MDGGLLIEEVSMNQLHEKLNKHVDFEVSDVPLVCQILEKLQLTKGIDFTVDNSLNRIHLLTNLNLRSTFNELFVKSGIKVNELSVIEESLEEYFTKLIEKKRKIW